MHFVTREKPSPGRPWLRFWARAIDGALWGVLLTLLLSSLSFGSGDTNQTLLFNVLLLATWIFIEAGLLSTVGTTLGKFVLGIEVTSALGQKLTYRQALRRSLQVWWLGQALGIPIIMYVTNLAAYRKLSRDGETRWDAQLGLQVTHRPIRVVGTSGIVLTFVALFVFRMVIHNH
ncbi:RDD family protein [Paenibacillus cremeus]|uniref:RDD family protein n=1 Tax=Paenibacillus cremeus TaxID=2163881 RepID=A0A559KFJ3_9BACL|nr:RDD family protein [Paenibacillus cremeus]TVY10889.1 RDD family protein [Paenibacillus cremeus]